MNIIPHCLMVAKKLSSTFILDLHAVKEKHTVKYIPLMEHKMRLNSLFHCYRLRDIVLVLISDLKVDFSTYLRTGIECQISASTSHG